MPTIFDAAARSVVRTALARDSYRNDNLRLTGGWLEAARWLVSTQYGLFAVSDSEACLVAHGWYFGLCRRGNRIFLFENCARNNRLTPMGRIAGFDLVSGGLANPRVLAKDLDARCHQIAFVDDLLCVLDTANQRVLRFTDQGQPVDVKCPFPAADSDDDSGEYMHINAIAPVAGEIAIMAHNARRVPPRGAELIMLDRDWNETRRLTLQDNGCHDIVEDSAGLLWHCASMTGEIICSDGRRVQVTTDRMTRGLAFGDNGVIVGASVFGPRSIRDRLPGSVIMFDRSFRQVAEVQLGGPPADIIAL